MFDQLRAAAKEMEAALAELDPKSMIGTQPARCLELLGGHERAVAAARLRLTARASEMNHWQRQGFRSFEDWLAATFGTTTGQARRKTRTAKNLDNGHDRTADALADGEISEDEAEVIADAADKNPAAEQELLDTARNENGSHKDLQDRAANAKAAGESDRARADRLRRGRRAGWGVDRDGFWTLHGRSQPEVGAEMKARLAAAVDHIFDSAGRAGTREGHDRYRADAIADLILGPDRATDARPGRSTPPTGAPDPATAPDQKPGPAKGPASASAPDSATSLDPPAGAATGPPSASAATTTPAPKEMVLVIDLETLRRGCVRPGETCHIRGVGPVPVEVARSWVDDAFIKAVIRDGDDIRLVHHFGRTINARLRTALDLAESVCAVPRCDNPRLEYHHLDRHADMGPTSWWNLGRPCTRCHHQATHDGYRLAGTPGNRLWINPDGIVERADDPTLVGRPPPEVNQPRPGRAPHDELDTGRSPPAPPPDHDADAVDLDKIDTIEAFDQLVLIEPARAP